MDITSVNAMIPSHLSEEPAASFILDSLGLVPVIHAGMRLGEGTGASAMMPLLDMALAVFQTAATFESSGIRLNDYDPKALT
jgi:nicotinate-nucleotide--dimethylbenzimidazole phosphoribosyltransferase